MIAFPWLLDKLSGILLVTASARYEKTVERTKGGEYTSLGSLASPLSLPLPQICFDVIRLSIQRVLPCFCNE